MSRTELRLAVCQIFGLVLIAYGLQHAQDLWRGVRNARYGLPLPFLPPALGLGYLVVGVVLLRGLFVLRHPRGDAPGDSGPTRAGLRAFALGALGALAVLLAVVQATLPMLPDPGAREPGMFITFDNRAPRDPLLVAWQQWSALGYGLLGLLVGLTPMRLLQWVRGMAVRERRPDRKAMDGRELLQVGRSVAVVWFSAHALTAAAPILLLGARPPHLLFWFQLARVAVFAALAWWCLRSSGRGVAWRHPASLIGYEVGAVLVLLALVPDAARFVAQSPSGRMLGHQGPLATGELAEVVVIALVASWVLYAAWRARRWRRRRGGALSPELDVFS